MTVRYLGWQELAQERNMGRFGDTFQSIIHSCLRLLPSLLDYNESLRLGRHASNENRFLSNSDNRKQISGFR